MRQTFNLIEAGAEAGNEVAKLALEWISGTIGAAFKLASEGAAGRHLPKLDGSDSCERVAEALAVWIKESAPRAFADMTGTRYSVTGLDCSAEGMERLRDQSEFILLAYPGADTTPDDLAADWIRDMDSSDQGEGFDYDAAEQAIRAYVIEATESGYLGVSLAENAAYLRGETREESDDGEPESAPFRLYVRDNAPDAD
jgi:hypothetical protein